MMDRLKAILARRDVIVAKVESLGEAGLFDRPRRSSRRGDLREPAIHDLDWTREGPLRAGTAFNARRKSAGRIGFET